FDGALAGAEGLVVVVSQEDSEHIGAFSERVSAMLERFPLSTIVTVMHESAIKDDFAGTQYSRVIPISPYDFFKTSKLDYVLLLKCRAQFFDISPSDLFSMTTLGFTVFIRMTLNQRFLGVAFHGSVLSDSKYQKMLKKDSLYILGRETSAYLEYINTYFDTSGSSLRKRSRSLFLAICQTWLELSEYIVFDFKTAPEEAVQKHYQDLFSLAEQLLVLMESEEGLWDTFKDAIQNELFEKWRGPWIAVYAAYMSKKSQVGNPLDTFMAALFCDIGLFDISDQVAQKSLASGESSLAEGEITEYRKHPVLSLNRCLLKKVPLSEAVKAILVSVHERADGQGFPSQTPPELLPVEASLIRFAEMIDLGVRTTLKETGVGFRFLKEKTWEKESTNPGSFSKEFLDKIAESLI
ncbi:MAG: hypothetical protein J7501_16595, partial [Bdellovibrio sp.]|nr:hypothetical protein [Bdellovibrio sp.]